MLYGSLGFAIVSLFLDHVLAATESYHAVPRWGQAAALINNVLYIHGGKTDEFNAMGYTNAPTNNDLLILPFNQSFDASSPPWQRAVANDTSLAPAMAWHTLSGYTTIDGLLFGGIPSNDSPDVLPGLADSAWLLDIEGPHWSKQEESWASEPIRRIHHSTVSARDGQVYLFGGERADGSGITYSDHLRFKPDGPTFEPLPTENAPPGLTGHTSVLIQGGDILVFGGVAEGNLVPMSTIWTFQSTRANSTWTRIESSTDSIPPPRRAFAAAAVGERVIIHGGSDASLQSTYGDGWELDMTRPPYTWRPLEGLSALGPRRDHFAVSSGSNVIFGFGYGQSGPADAELHVYDSQGSSMVPSFTPAPVQSVTQSLPTPTATRPVPTSIPPTNTHTSDTPEESTSPDDEGKPQDAKRNSNKKLTAVAVGTALGLLGFLAGGLIIIIFIRRRRREAYFMALYDSEDPGDSPQSARTPVPVAGGFEKHHPGQHGWGTVRNLGASGLVAFFTPGRRPPPLRRDMLADEDTREFEDWRETTRPGFGPFGGSTWSLKSIISRVRREPSTFSTRSGPGTPYSEKNDPFSDGAALMVDEGTGFIGAAVPSSSRPTTSRRHQSYGSSASGRSYVDPFSDPIHEVDEHGAYDDDPPHSIRMIHPHNPHLHIETVIPGVPHTLSPVTEVSSQTSRSLDGHHSASTHSQLTSGERGTSPFDVLSSGTSLTSYDPSRSPHPSSIIDSAVAVGGANIRRSDTWWNRFARTSFLDRHSSTRSHGSNFEFRDPNPPPRLTAIEENQNSGSPEESPGSHHSNSLKRGLSKLSKKSKMYVGGHGKSMSSLQTADSDALERMGDNMEVVQHLRSQSARTRDSSGSMSIDMSYDGHWPGQDEHIPVVTSPTDMQADSPTYTPRTTPPLNSSQTPPAVSSAAVSLTSLQSGSSVASRVKDYERRASQDLEGVHLAKNTRTQDERPRRTSQVVGYGLAPRPSLYVANPDTHKHQASGSST